jgi:hypothetical protein
MSRRSYNFENLINDSAGEYHKRCEINHIRPWFGERHAGKDMIDFSFVAPFLSSFLFA